MKIVELYRHEESIEYGTIGLLKINKRVFCMTLEPPDKLNAQNVSSIPAQQYICEPFISEKHGKTFLVTNVPGRSSVLFHAGNTVEHTAGCILLGSSLGKLQASDRALVNSGCTFKKFAEAVGITNNFHLTIHEVY